MKNIYIKSLYNIGFMIGATMTIIILITECKKDSTSSTPPVNNQSSVIIKDTVINSQIVTETDIFRILPTKTMKIIFKNNSITAQNTNSHIVEFGSEQSTSSDHMLDSIIITGNKIVWLGTDLKDIDEGIFTGFNVNATIEYNFIQNCPYGSPVKSDGFTFTSGGIAYNVYGPSFKVGTGAKGTNGVKFYNNTFYNTRDTGQDVIGSVYINSNFDDALNLPAKNCQIFNNIFYTKHQVPNIYCDRASLSGLQSDYNVFWCEAGEPVIFYDDKIITLSAWQAMGFDTHSVVKNPQFTDFTSLIPSAPLNYGKNLGNTWQNGLSVTTKWDGTDPVVTSQGETWQAGAYIIK
jgi:hypothetical protein